MVLSALLWPMLAHVLWTAGLYVLLTVFRAPAVWGLGTNADGRNPFVDVEARTSANLSNQFEWPLFFHLGCVLLILSERDTDRTALVLAWIFVGGRVLHSAAQIAVPNVRLRGVVFMINFLAAGGLWLMLVNGR